MTYVLTAAVITLLLALLLSLIRMIRGPSDVDRVLCLDFIALLAAATIALHSVSAHDYVYLDAVLVLSIISFFGTIVFARYIEGRAD